jgi:hypothetical protein
MLLSGTLIDLRVIERVLKSKNKESQKQGE